MKHLTFADKSLLLGDVAADLLVEYTAALGNAQQADSVAVHAFGADGDEVEATLVLNQGAALMVESTHTSLPEPDNEDAIEQMRRGLIRLTSPAKAHPDLESEASPMMDSFDF